MTASGEQRKSPRAGGLLALHQRGDVRGDRIRQPFEVVAALEHRDDASAGFDAHMRDPLANLTLLEADFNWATRKVMEGARLKSASSRLRLASGSRMCASKPAEIT